MKYLFSIALVGLLVAASELKASGDWPEWRGPNRNSIISTGESINWSKLDKAKVLWETKVGIGYSSISVVGDRAYTIGHDGDGNETVYCLNVGNGKEVWKFTYPAKLLPAMHVGGPNATPTVADELSTP
ncbi:MAG: hypothetical protein M2R45_04602 [Verrucomicrobia subdivision 3 bacterium]|nr:hypothetical protein [Limisphaerales bacterium]MCS1417335.1 hypothetical protein [Limisphaerales bacterium]